MRNIQHQFNLAFQLHQSGKFQDAINLYLKVLFKQQKNSHLLYLLGTAYLQLGQRDKGIVHLQSSIGINPKNALALNNLGNALKDQRDFSKALDCFEKALALDQGYADAHYNKGIVLQFIEKLDDAVTSFDSAIALNPGYTEAYYNRGVALQALQRFDEAVASYEHAVALNSSHADAFNNCGVALQALKKYDAALSNYQKAIALRSNYVDAHYNLGHLLQDLRRFDEALDSYEKAIELKTDYVDAHYNRGLVFQELRRFDEALDSYEKAIALSHDYVDAHYNRGLLLKDLWRFDEALIGYEQALALKPNYAEVSWNKSLLLLLMGQYAEGWELYESRIRHKDFEQNYYNFPQPAWRGEDNLRGKKILIYAEQGYGDVIQFCRYLPHIEALGAEIIFEAPQSLIPLILTLGCDMHIVAKDQPLPDFDLHCPIMSLPYAFKTKIETIPSATAYLSADEDKVSNWRVKLGAKKAIRVGLVWSGAAGHKNDHNRSIGLAQLSLITGLPVEWHSLQKEYRPHDLEVLNQNPQIQQHQEGLNDFSDTAALIDSMDLIITVDTSVAHVAGALGKPVWILLPNVPDYRWMVGSEDSPWYQAAKLYRQPALGDWQTVIQSVQTALSLEAGIEVGGTPEMAGV